MFLVYTVKILYLKYLDLGLNVFINKTPKIEEEEEKLSDSHSELNLEKLNQLYKDEDPTSNQRRET